MTQTNPSETYPCYGGRTALGRERAVSIENVLVREEVPAAVVLCTLEGRMYNGYMHRSLARPRILERAASIDSHREF